MIMMNNDIIMACPELDCWFIIDKEGTFCSAPLTEDGGPATRDEDIAWSEVNFPELCEYSSQEQIVALEFTYNALVKANRAVFHS